MEKAKGAVTESNFSMKKTDSLLWKNCSALKREVYYLLLLEDNIKYGIDSILQNF